MSEVYEESRQKKALAMNHQIISISEKRYQYLEYNRAESLKIIVFEFQFKCFKGFEKLFNRFYAQKSFDKNSYE